MATGFVQRFKGKITTAINGLWMGGAQGQVVFVTSGAPTSGASGTLKGIATVGSLLIDITTAGGALYQNTGTSAIPTWTSAPLTGVAGLTSGTIDGTTIGASTPSTGTFTYYGGSVAGGLTAVGTNRGTSLALTKQFNIVATAASTAVGVTLPTVATIGIGSAVWVANDGPSNSFHVYGGSSDTIDAQAAATGVVLTNAKLAMYLATAAATFISFRFDIVRSA